MGLAARISFSTERSHIRVRWDQSERLTPGSLVAISDDGFKTNCSIVVVASRRLIGGLLPDATQGEDEKNTPPRIEIFWSRSEDAFIDPLREFVMIQPSSGYYEACRHTMIGLQMEAQQR